MHSANQDSPYGTSAQFVVVPAAQAIPLPAGVSFEAGACLGVPALTAHRCVFAHGPIDGLTVLVTGGAGAVGHYAIEMARHGGATVIATASSTRKQRAARHAGADHVIDYRQSDAATRILELTRARGVDRVIDVAFGANLPRTAAVIAANGTIATYASDAVPQPTLPFYALMRRNATIRAALVYGIPSAAMRAAVDGVTELLTRGGLTHPIARRVPLETIASAHSGVERGDNIGNVVVIPPPAAADRGVIVH